MSTTAMPDGDRPNDTLSIEENEQMRRKRVFAVAVASILALALVLAIARVSGASPPPAPIGNGSVAALDHNGTSPDSLPADLLASPGASWLRPPAQAQRVYDDGKRAVWLAAGAITPTTICFVTYDAVSGRTGIGCSERSDLTNRPVWASPAANGDGTRWIVGLVDDAVSAVEGPDGQKVLVHDNVYLLDGLAGGVSGSLTFVTANGNRSFPFHLPSSFTIHGHSATLR